LSTGARRHAPLAGLFVVSLGASLATMDLAVNVAFPSITDAFTLETRSIRWVVISYVLTYSSLMLVAFLKNLAKLGAKFRGVFMLVNSDRMLHRGLQQLCFAVSWKPIIPVSRSFPNDGRDCRRTLSPVRQRPCMIGSTVSAYGHG
jgi:hypothetical protein